MILIYQVRCILFVPYNLPIQQNWNQIASIDTFIQLRILFPELEIIFQTLWLISEHILFNHVQSNDLLPNSLKDSTEVHNF